MRNAKTARDRFLVGFSGVLLAGVVSYGADAPATHQLAWKELPSGAHRVEAILTRENGEQKTVAECFAALGLDDAADALRSAPKRSAVPDPATGRSGC